MRNSITVNNKTYNYYIGLHNVIIKTSNAKSKMIDISKIMQHSPPNFIKMILSFGKPYKLSKGDIKKYVKKTHEQFN
jgi:deoxyadenosine/deoxycytidine kinase